VIAVTPGAGDSEGAMVMASRPSTAASAAVMTAAKYRRCVFVAASCDADRLECVEARREQDGKGARIP